MAELLDELLEELERRWRAMFEALAAGDDLPPGERLRAEGMMEAAVLVGAAPADELLTRMDARYAQAFGQPLADAFGADWRDVFPFPQVPAMARRAPVYPTTRDEAR